MAVIYGNDKGGQRYSAARQITSASLDRVDVAWTYRTGIGDGPPGRSQPTPVFIDGMLYVTSPLGRAARVLCQRDSSPLTQKIVQDHVRRAARRAQLSKSGVHRLRHTFRSHLAMRGAPARAIQEFLAISEPGEIG